jgi:hypothetical protein
MTKRGIRAIYVMLGLVALWFTSAAVANAQVTVTSVKVTVKSGALTAVYCDTTLNCAGSGGINVWNLGGGVALAPTETLVLTQNGAVPGHANEGDFDTSDQVTPTTVGSCSTSNLCTVTIEINGQPVYGPSSLGDPLDFFNKDDGGTITNEAHAWMPAGSKPNYTLSLGYADNVHSAGCPGGVAANCFPSPFSTGVTHFIGAGLASDGSCTTGNCFDGGALLITALLAPPSATGRMTGGGSVILADGTRVTHGFEIHCDITDVPNNLEVNWPHANNFHMDTLTSAVCTDHDPQINNAPPAAEFDTFVGTGTGKLNGVAGATISFTFVDAGEPGTKDTAKYIIKDHLGNVVLNVPTLFLDKGNQQAHTDNK